MSDATQLAKQGDPQAIEALLNRSLQSKGITAKASLSGTCLRILLESAQAPSHVAVVKFIRSGMERLAPEGIETVNLYGRRSGEAKFEWKEQIQLGRSVVEVEKPAPVDLKLKATAIGKGQERSSKNNVVLFWWSQRSPFQKLLSIVVCLLSGLCVLGFLLQFLIPASPEATLPTEDPTLPPHTVSQTSLVGDSKRVQVDSSNPQLTHEECSKLAESYAPYAGSGGQVVVQKPSVNPPWNGRRMPFCVDNMEGEGIILNDFNFQ